MQITSVVPENVQDVTLSDLKYYNLKLSREYCEYSKKMFAVQRSLEELKYGRSYLSAQLTVQIAKEELKKTKASDRMSPAERKALVEVRTHTLFEKESEYVDALVQEKQLAQIKANLDFQADRIKQAILVAATNKKYSGVTP